MPRYVYKGLSAQSRNIFTRVYCAFTVLNILNIITCPLAILLNILAAKTKATTALQIKRLARLFGYDIFFAVGLVFSTYGYQNEKKITPMPAEMTSFKPHAHEESEGESYLS